MALADVNAAERDQRGGAEVELFRAENAAVMMSEPVRMPPSVRSTMRVRRLFIISTCCVSATPSSQAIRRS
jgi:hypothetical protein